ncbi:MAG: tannase/feruloyl esterase family alpha/beta hydrolase [Rubrivivax sp.]
MRFVPILGLAALAGACSTPGVAPPMAAARPGTLQSCEDLAARFAFPQTVVASAARVAAGTLSVAGKPVAEHCLVSGRMAERKSAVDGQTYAIGFQMRLPVNWNGRFFHQGNGGLDGIIQPAVGLVGGGGELSNALAQGFAVLSSDAGHNVRQLPMFGVDPDARLDYGYKAVGTLTPMAKALVAAAYGRGPDRSYFGGCSNGGRHAMVAASRYAADYDGFLAGNPGFQLPKAALAQLAGAQLFHRAAVTNDLATAMTPVERKLVSDAIVARCDALDGAKDHAVGDIAACQRAFDLQRDVPTCTAERNGQCLSAQQKDVLAKVFAGATDSKGQRLYAPFNWDPGLAGADWAGWKFVSSVTNRDPVAVAYVFQTPPADASAAAEPKLFALGFDLDRGTALINATSGPYTQSAMQFMTPPGDTDLAALRARGAKLVVYHGSADGVFSAGDTAAWIERVGQRHADASSFARLFVVPGMNHCRGGPATDQFDLLTPLVQWVEEGRAPDRVVAQARGAGNPVPNPEVPASWAADRTRPLCPWPQVARYKGSGDIERAENFVCQ